MVAIRLLWCLAMTRMAFTNVEFRLHPSLIGFTMVSYVYYFRPIIDSVMKSLIQTHFDSLNRYTFNKSQIVKWCLQIQYTRKGIWAFQVVRTIFEATIGAM